MSDEQECPQCSGKGHIEHLVSIEFVLGETIRRGRLYWCHQCLGTGRIPAEPKEDDDAQ